MGVVQSIQKDPHRYAAPGCALKPWPEDPHSVVVVSHGLDAGSLELRDGEVSFESRRERRHVVPRT